MINFKSSNNSIILRSTDNTPVLKKVKKQKFRNIISVFLVLAVIIAPAVTIFGLGNIAPIQVAQALDEEKAEKGCYRKVTTMRGVITTSIDCTEAGAIYKIDDTLVDPSSSGTSSSGTSSSGILAISNPSASSGGGIQLGDTNPGWEAFDPCGNSKQPDDEYPILTMWPGGSANGITSTNGLSPALKKQTDEDLATLNSEDYVSSLRAASKNYTAQEWYGNTPIYWDNYVYEQEGGCKLALDMMNSIPNIILQINTILTEITSTIISWVTTADVVSVFFFGEDALLSNLIESFKDSFFLAYLAPIVFLSTLWLAWKGLVKRQSRDSIQGIIWMFGAAAAALTFMTNPTWFAQGANKAVFDISSSIISIATATTATTPEGNTGDMCGLPPGAESGATRTVQCALWVNFTYLPWVTGQIGSGDNQTYALQPKADGQDIVPTYSSGSTSLGLVLMDAKVYNRLDALNAVNSGSQSTWTPPDSYKTLKKQQWQAIVEDVAGFGENTDGLHKASVYPVFSGQEVATRWNVAAVSVVGQLIAFIPLLILGLTMIGQQVIFVFLLIVAPLFLTIGIHPGYGRRLALGWLEMTLSTIIKRLAAAALVGILLAYYGAVIQSTAGAWIALGYYGSMIMLAVGSIAILVFRGKIMKQAGDIIDLNGQQVGKGNVKNFLTGAGSMIAGGVGAGLAEKKMGGNVAQGVIKGAAKNYSGPMPATPSLVKQTNEERKAHLMKEGQKKVMLDKLDQIDQRKLAAENANRPVEPNPTPKPVETTRRLQPIEASPNRSQYRDSRPVMPNELDRPVPNINDPAELQAWQKTWTDVEKALYNKQHKEKETLMRLHEKAIKALDDSVLEIPQASYEQEIKNFESKLKVLNGNHKKDWAKTFQSQKEWVDARRTQMDSIES